MHKKDFTSKNGWIIWGCIMICIMLIWGYFFYGNTGKHGKPFIVKGNSMLPTIADGSTVCVDRESFIWKDGKLSHGDIATFALLTSNNWQEEFIKRVIAIPWDTVSFSEWKIILNDTPLKESYIQWITYSPDQIGIISLQLRSSNNRVPYGQYLVLWDNRSASKDSTRLGFISQDQFTGKVISINQSNCNN